MGDTSEPIGTPKQCDADIQTNWGTPAPSPGTVQAMKQNETNLNTFEVDPPVVDDWPSDRQMNAILLMLAGKTDCDIAEEIGVARVTIWRWRTRNPAFVGELNRCRRELFAAASNKTAMLLLRAINTVEKDLQAPDSTIRWRATRLMVQMANRRLLPTDIEPTEPHQVYKQMIASGIDPAEIETGDNENEDDKGDPKGSSEAA